MPVNSRSKCFPSAHGIGPSMTCGSMFFLASPDISS
jgi:hypothetical protein